MVMAPLPQVAQDLIPLMDPAIMYASRAGEHKGVMQQAIEMHKIEQNKGDVWKGAHVAKIEAVHGGPRTRFTNSARASAEVYECHLGYTVSLYAMADNQKTFLNKNYLRQWGSQQAEAIARSVDRILLGAFATFSNIDTSRAGNAILANTVEEAMFELQAAEDDSDSMIQVVCPTAHLRDLVWERSTTANNSSLIERPLTPDAAKMLTSKPSYTILGSMIKEARNSPKYGSNGHTGVFRKTGIKMVTAPVLQRATERDERTGGGATTIILRKLWGFVLPPQAQRNWLRGIQAAMPIGGR